MISNPTPDTMMALCYVLFGIAVVVSFSFVLLCDQRRCFTFKCLVISSPAADVTCMCIIDFFLTLKSKKRKRVVRVVA